MSSFRNIISENQTVVSVIAAVGIGYTVWRIVTVGFGGGISLPDTVWVYDLSTDEISEKASGLNPPFTVSSGGTAVQAQLFSCSDCSDSETHQIGILFKYSDEMKAVLDRGSTDEDSRILMNPKSELVASVEMAKAGRWEPAEKAMLGLFNKAVSVCNGDYKRCYP